jgi:hypothetical protein
MVTDTSLNRKTVGNYDMTIRLEIEEILVIINFIRSQN